MDPQITTTPPYAEATQPQVPQVITTTTHFFIAIAAACFAWCLFILPAMTLIPSFKQFDTALIIFTLTIFCVIIPSIMLSNESYKLNIYGEDAFRLAKLLSVVGAIIIIQGCLIYNYKNPTSTYGPKVMTIITYLFFIVNILEACALSFINKDKPDFDKVTEFPEMNLLLGIIAILMVLYLFYKLIMSFVSGSPGIGLNASDGLLKLQCNFSIFLILAYTFWNLGFKIQEIESPLVLLFLVVSLVLPLVVHIFGLGDWLQVRALSLLFVMIVELGLGKGSDSIFPSYNKTGYDEKETQESPISQFFSKREFKIFLVVMSFMCLIGCVTYGL